MIAQISVPPGYFWPVLDYRLGFSIPHNGKINGVVHYGATKLESHDGSVFTFFLKKKRVKTMIIP